MIRSPSYIACRSLAYVVRPESAQRTNWWTHERRAVSTTVLYILRLAPVLLWQADAVLYQHTAHQDDEQLVIPAFNSGLREEYHVLGCTVDCS